MTCIHKTIIRILLWLILKNIWKSDECVMENNFSRPTKLFRLHRHS